VNSVCTAKACRENAFGVTSVPSLTESNLTREEREVTKIMARSILIKGNHLPNVTRFFPLGDEPYLACVIPIKNAS